MFKLDEIFDLVHLFDTVCIVIEIQNIFAKSWVMEKGDEYLKRDQGDEYLNIWRPQAEFVFCFCVKNWNVGR